MREAIHVLKYGRLHPAAQKLGQMLASAIAQLSGEAPADLLVIPVPLHRSKQAQRGFNQSRSLAAQALQSLRRTHPQWRLTLAPSTLMRLRATGSQAGLTPRQRRLNVRGAFSVSDSSQVSGQHILVVDDILTTGATARAAAQTLLKAGAASVWVATLARAQRAVPFGRDFNFSGEKDGGPPDGASPDNEPEYNQGQFGEAMHATKLGSDSSIELEQTSF
jgi:ComF family protein